MNARLGEKKRRQLNLLDREPLCIFCGGAVPASTGDHQRSTPNSGHPAYLQPCLLWGQ
jgi:hypothetical protein